MYIEGALMIKSCNFALKVDCWVYVDHYKPIAVRLKHLSRGTGALC